MPIIIVSLYKFVTLDDYASLKSPLLKLMATYQIKGTLLLAKEGINGTIAADRAGIDALLKWLRTDSRFADLNSKESYAHKMPFYRGKVKLKKEIVTLGVQNINPQQMVGTYVEPKHWNRLICDPQVLLIDTRNDYEVKIGAFKGAINPAMQTFRDFSRYAKEQLASLKHKKIAMYCTGGIRCEKSTALLKKQGFKEVYHLRGGILKYLQEVPAEQSMWQGECFVFDNRVAVNQALEQGQYQQCYACRYPITSADKKSPHYMSGVSCPHCYDSITQQQRDRFQQREKQIKIAKTRGEEHIGTPTHHIYHQRRTLKYQHKNQQRQQQNTH